MAQAAHERIREEAAARKAAYDRSQKVHEQMQGAAAFIGRRVTSAACQDGEDATAPSHAAPYGMQEAADALVRRMSATTLKDTDPARRVSSEPPIAASVSTIPALVRSEMMSLAPGSRVAVVTGASSGMGREFARQLSHRDDVDCLWLIARRIDQLEKTAAVLPKPCHCLPLDLTDGAAIKELDAVLKETRVKVRYLVNAAGFGKFGTYETISAQSAEGMIDLNCKALVDITKAALPYMDRGSRILELASCSAFTPLPSMNVYAASKVFVVNYTRGLRWELRGRGITATAVCPAWVKTGFEKVARDTSDGKAVRHLLFAQKAPTVVSRALRANRLHFAVACCGIPAFFLRIVGKFLPHCVTMAGWELIRRL